MIQGGILIDLARLEIDFGKWISEAISRIPDSQSPKVQRWRGEEIHSVDHLHRITIRPSDVEPHPTLLLFVLQHV